MKKQLMRTERTSGFTLIELLVVISIIGLLSSIVVAAVSVARQKGNVAAAQTFDAHTYAALYNNLAAEWTFDNDTTAVVKDQSGNSVNLSLTNATQLDATTPTPFNGGKSLLITPGSLIATSGNIPFYTGDYSISFWLRPQSIDAYEFMSNGYATGGSSGLWRFAPHTSNDFFFEVKGNTGSVSVSGPALATNQWSQVVGVCSGTNPSKVALYVNGVQVSAPGKVISSSGSCLLSNAGISITGTTAGGLNGSNVLPYNVDNIRVYRQALPVSYIQKQYLAGLPTHQDLSIREK